SPLQKALRTAGHTGADLDQLGKETGLDAETLLAALTELELDGKAARLTGGRFAGVSDIDVRR
nr:hypothetical protein [Acidobacteriota bacterium]